MRRFYQLLTYLALAVSGVSIGSITEASQKTEFSAQMVQTLPSNKQRVGKVYVGDSRMRTEMGEGKQKRIMIVDTEQKTAWMLNPELQEYVKMQGPVQGQAPRGPRLPGDPESLCNRSENLFCNREGVEKINGRKTEKWEVEVSQDGRKMRSLVWIDRSLGFPVREELPGGLVRELRNIQEGPQPDHLFQIPEAYKRIEMPKEQPAQFGQPGSGQSSR